MRFPLSTATRRRLETQGFIGLDDASLSAVEPWLRLSPALCTLFIALGTAIASPVMLTGIMVIAMLGTILPVHPFDLIYNYGLRFVTRTPSLPHNGAPRRFACGMAAVWLAATAFAFASGAAQLGYVLGGILAIVGFIVSSTHFCIPSTIYRLLFHPNVRHKT